MKKRLTFACALVTLFSAASCLAACSSGTSYDYTLTIWAADAATNLTKTQAETWAASIAETDDVKIGISVQAVGEGDAAGYVTTDVEAAADLYCFAQDQLSRLVTANGLSAITDTNTANELIANNDETSVSASTVGSTLYAYPLTSDNGFFMYYDASVFTDTSKLENMEDIIQVCKDAGRTIYFNVLDSAWYNAAYFYGFGCESEWETNAEGYFTGYTDTYNSANGILACKALYNLLVSDQFVNSATASTGWQASAAVVISGTWDYTDSVNALGANFGATDLPSVTATDDNGVETTVHLSSYSGCKLLGVKPQTDPVKLAYAQSLALYLSGETCQLERFNTLGWGPSNLVDQENDAVKSNLALQALNLQNQYATPQGNYPGDWWTTCGNIGTSLAATDGSTDAIKTILATYAGTIDSYVNG